MFRNKYGSNKGVDLARGMFVTNWATSSSFYNGCFNCYVDDIIEEVTTNEGDDEAISHV